MLNPLPNRQDETYAKGVNLDLDMEGEKFLIFHLPCPNPS